MTKISAVIIAKNEEEMVGDCLSSVAWADEVVLIDTGSTDRTIEIARNFGARIKRIDSRQMNFALWRTAAIDFVKGDWIFYLDADERATEELALEMKQAVKGDDCTAYDISRRNFFLGQEMHYSGVGTDHVKRFFKKSALKKWQSALHEDPVFEGKMGRLKNQILHFTHRDLTSMMEKTIKWTAVEAKLLFEANHPPVVWWRFFRMMATKFWERVIRQQAWRDGTVGWINSLFEVFNTFIIYARLWEMQQKKQKKD